MTNENFELPHHFGVGMNLPYSAFNSFPSPFFFYRKTFLNFQLSTSLKII